MNRDDWARVKGIVAGALSRADADRPDYLALQCGSDVAMRAEVESLLASALRAADLYEDPTLFVAGARVMLGAFDNLQPLPPRSLHPLVDSADARTLQNPFQGTERYLVRRQIGIGGMGVVYEVEDRTRKQVVALKTLLRSDPGDIYRLKREFRSLADIAHPNLVSLYDLVVDDQQCFFTMELVDGVSFVEHVRGSESGLADEARVRHALPQLIGGVQELHQRGKLHRDIKPSNVLVTLHGRVVILDFGLTQSVGTDDIAAERGLAGTPAYLSPEQCTGLEVSSASDWYSVGATLYHALTGSAPFDGSLAELLHKKTTIDPLPPAVVAPGTPADLSALCTQLLARDPRMRLTGRDALSRLNLAAAGGGWVSADSAGSAFVGRESDLELLTAAFARVKEGRGASVFIHGPSGIGKSALVQRFFDRRLIGERHVALRGRCHEHESVPYKGLDGVVDALSRYLRTLSGTDAAALMPPDAGALARLFPVMRGAPAPADSTVETPGDDPVALRRRAFAALRELLRRLAVRQPLVVEIDDFQWADADSAAVLTELFRAPDAPPLLLLLSFRSEEVAAKPFLRALVERIDLVAGIPLPLPPLPEHAVNQLIATLVSRSTGDGERQEIVHEAGGNPFLVEELARYAAAGRETRRGATLNEMLHRRIDVLPAESRAFLETLAVCGRPIVPAYIFEACGLAGDERPLVARLRSAHFLRSSRSADRVEMYHDRIRETLAADVSTDAARRIHELMAQILVAHGDDDPEALFDHYRAAGHDRLAAGQAAAAALKASAVLAFDRAAVFYRHALDLQPDDARRLMWIEGLAAALENAGRPAEAADACLDLARASSDIQRVEWLRKAAEQLLIGGHIDRGFEIVRTVLDAVGIRMARRPETALASMLFRRAQLRWRGLDFVARDERAIAKEELLRIDTCWSMTTGLAMVDNIQAAAFHARQLLVALETGEPHRVARALALEAGFTALGGGAGIKRSATIARRAVAVADEVGDRHAVALCSLSLGIAAFLIGQWKIATGHCERAIGILRDECTGVLWELNLSEDFFLGSLLFRGELRDVAHWLPGLLQTARERGNLYFETELRTRMNLVWLALDKADEGEREAHEATARWSASGFHRQHYNHLLARVQTELYRGRGEAAWTLVDDHRDPLRRSLWLRVQFMRIETAYMRARCALAMAAAGRDVPRMRETATRQARQLAREALPWPAALAVLIRATLSHLEGDEVAAAASLEQAVDAFTRADMQLYAAVARRRLAAIVGGDRGRDMQRDADAWMATQEIRNPDGIARLMAPGYRDA